MLSVVGALLAVATPLLAGQVVNLIFAAAPFDQVLRIAIAIGVIAIVEAGLGLLQRWLSARLGEDLILDLRRAVFDHVLSMPVAFFTRTRTGALVSRLNNDVIGAQRAFSETLSGVVSNIVALVLALVVMIALSWQITLLALVLLPVFVIPARRMGRRLAQLELEGANHNAVMGNQMTERFSAPGATLVKLFGRPERESSEFAIRASRVRDIGVRSAMVQTVFMTALTLVSALALALVYGLGGWYALQGTLTAGAVVTLALLITRLYAPLTGLASARVEVMSALVSFERVFEILDLKPLITEPERPETLPDGPLSVRFDDVTFAYPSAEKVSLASLEEVAVLDTRGGVDVIHDVSFEVGAGQMVALVGSSGAGKSTMAQLLARLYDVDDGAVRLGGVDVRDLSFADLRRAVGMVTQDGHLFHESVRENLLLAAPEAERGRPVGRVAPGPAGRADRLAAGRAGHGGGGAGLPAVRRRAAAADHRPAAAGPPAGGHPGRGDRPPRLDLRGGRAGRPRRGPGGADGGGDRAPAVDHPSRRPDPGDRGRPGGRSAAGTPICWRPAVATPSSTRPSSRPRRP